MNQLEKSIYIALAASILLRAKDKPVSMDELFPPIHNVRRIGGNWRKTISSMMVSSGLAKPKGQKFIADQESKLEKLIIEYLTTALSADPDFRVEYFDVLEKISESLGYVPEEKNEDMRRTKYNGKLEEMRGRASVAYRALKKLSGSNTPLSRSQLFTGKSGDKFQERAAIIPTWQLKFLNKIQSDGIIKSTSQNGVELYEVDNKQAMQDLYEGNVEPCVYTLIDPENPCTQDHSKKGSSHTTDPSVEESPESVAADKIPECTESSTQVGPDTNELGVEPNSTEQAELIVKGSTDDIVSFFRTQKKILKNLELQEDLWKKNTGVLNSVTSALKELGKAVEGIHKHVSLIDSKVSELDKKVVHVLASDAKLKEHLKSTLQKSGAMDEAFVESIRTHDKGIRSIAEGIASIKGDMTAFQKEAKSDRRKRLEILIQKMGSAAVELDTFKDLALESLNGINSSKS